MKNARNRKEEKPKMKINTLGQLLKYYREKHGIRQEAICEGICSVATLSKIENGSRILGSLYSESLLGRLGKEIIQFEIILNDEDYALWNIRQEIERYASEHNFYKVNELLNEYMSCVKNVSSVHKQFVLLYQAKCSLLEAKSQEEKNVLIYEALKCTKPNIGNDNGLEQLFNPTEIRLILYLIQNNYSGWTVHDKEEQLLNILDFIKRIYTGRLFEETVIDVLLELIELKKCMHDYQGVIKYADEAIEIISRGRGIRYLAELHFCKAQAIYHAYQETGEWDINKGVCREECLMAYYTFEAFERLEDMIEIEKFCEEKLEWQIIK